MPLDMEKLRKLLLVLLSSDQAGEVMSASAAIAKALRKDGKDIHWLVKQIGQPQAQAPPKAAKSSTQTSWSAHWIDQLLYCVERIDRVQRQSQREFLFSLAEQMDNNPKSWQPSHRQRDWLNDIYSQLKKWEHVYG